VSALQTLGYLAIAAFVLARVITRQLRGSRVTAGSLVVMPAVLLLVGVAGMRGVLPSASTEDLLFLAADAVLLVLLGLARGASVVLGERDGALFQRGTRLTLVLWLVTIAVRVAVGFGAHLIGVDNRLASASIALTVGFTLGAQNLAVWLRVQRLGVPLAVSPGRR
jgi:hypothetical protein